MCTVHAALQCGTYDAGMAYVSTALFTKTARAIFPRGGVMAQVLCLSLLNFRRVVCPESYYDAILEADNALATL